MLTQIFLCRDVSPCRQPASSGRETSQYLAGEMAALEREQAQIDAQAARLEKRLRKVMNAGEWMTGLLVPVSGGVARV